MKQMTARLMALMISTTLLGACMSTTAIGAGDSWKEEVLLHDGQKMMVERSQTYGGRREIGQSLPVKEHKISFKLPGTANSITWTSEYSEELGRTNLKAVALHVLNKNPYIVSVPNLCLSYNKWGRPNPPYVVFRHNGKDWNRIALNELPVEFKDMNLVINNQGEAEILTAQSPVSAKRVKELNGELSQPEYKTILREPLPKARIEAMCDEMVLYNGSWILPNDPAAKKFIDSQNSRRLIESQKK